MSHHLKPAELPITQADGDAAIAAALERASIPTLMMSIVHLTGDASLLDGPVKPAPVIMGDVQGGLSEEDKASVRALALEALRAYRDRGCTLPPPPDPATVHRMMQFQVGQEVPDDYVPMMLEEMALDGQDQRVVPFDDVPAAVRRSMRVLVIGCGMSGLLAAIRLEEAGIPYLVVEKNDGIGGTWFENTYPGCRVDIANHFYCYSFEPNHDWSEFFSQRGELRDYFERCADRYGVRSHVRFSTEVVAARWCEDDAQWAVTLRGADGREERQSFDAVVSAVGQLNRPKIPDLPGLEGFQGASFHSAAWDHGVELAGRNVAVVGTGASALQLVPEVAKVAGRLTVFQRSPAWMIPNPNYHAVVSEEKKWLLKHVPYYARWYRFLLFWPGSDGLLPTLEIDPAWPHPERSVCEANDVMRQIFTDYMVSQLSDRPDLVEKVVPKYPPFVKRMLQDNGSWLAALKRDDVELETNGIARVEPDGIVDETGRHHPLDVLIFATGFHANRFLWPMEVVGRKGLDLGKTWGDDPRAYLGITVPDFPNLFCLYGPGTNLAHAGSIIFHSECQVRYVMGCLKALMTREDRALDCRPEVCADYVRRHDEAHARMVWSHPGTGSWYRNRQGRITVTSPFRLRDYWTWTREPDLGDYRLS
ncbi:MAG: flavin-containing monooxygenase [Myxococcota bacterium]